MSRLDPRPMAAFAGTDSLTVRWEPVTETIDEGAVEIVGYEVIVTKVDHKDPDALSRPVADTSHELLDGPLGGARMEVRIPARRNGE